MTLKALEVTRAEQALERQEAPAEGWFRPETPPVARSKGAQRVVGVEVDGLVGF